MFFDKLFSYCFLYQIILYLCNIVFFNIIKMKRLFVTGVLSLISIFSLSAQNYQEAVYLKSGSVVRGTIIEQQPNVSLKIKTADGSIFVYPMNEVEKITKEERTNRRSEKSNRIRTDVKGYRGLVEVGTIVNFRASGTAIDKGAFSATTSHGYQFNPHVFLGAGFGLDYHAAGKRLFIPLFVDLRTNFLDTNITPFWGIKAGYSIGSKKAYNKVSTGAYFNPTFGVRFILNRQSAMNVAFGYNLQQQVVKKDIHYNDDYFIYTGVYHYRFLRHALSLRLGVEF